MASPKPIPTEVKRMRGTLRPSRVPGGANAVAIVPAVEKDLAPPAELGDVGAGEWRHVLAVCPWIGAGDLRILRLYCLALDRHSALLALLAQEGTVLYTDKGYAYMNPAQGALATTEAQITKWLSLLGLTPSDRGRIGVAEVKARSTLEMLQDRQAKRAGRPAS